MGPIEVGAVTVGEKDFGKERPARRDGQFQALGVRFVWRRYIAKANGELQWASLGVVQIERRYVFEAYERLQKEIKARPNFRLRGVASLRGFFDLEIESDARCEFGIDIHLRQELKSLCSGSSACDQ